MWNDDGELTMGESGVEIMIDHLVELGHAKFFHIAGPPGWLAARGRSNAYESGLASHGLKSMGTAAGDWSAASGFEAAMRMPLDVGITAVVAANDQTALGAISALENRGVSIPRDMSVVGFDDIPESKFFRPPLTTVRFEFAEQGRIAIDRLLARIDGTTPEIIDTGPPALVIRSSSGPVPGK
jgi:LacI family transcriptional regulator